MTDIDWSHIANLVGRHAPEDLTIEFKGGWYALDQALAAEAMPKLDPDTQKEKLQDKVAADQFELAKDVIAFANTSGGLLVLGVTDRNGRAEELRPVRLTDARRLQLYDKIRAWTTPYIDELEVGFVSAPGDDERGCVLVYVPASSSAPHAVVEPNTYRHTWYLRDGASAVPLREPQIAVAYRDRFAGRDEMEERVQQVYADGVAELDPQEKVWLALAVCPARRGIDTVLDRHRLDELKVQTQSRQDDLPGGFLGHHGLFGRGRVVLRDSQPSVGRARDHLLHLYTDGRAFAAVGLDVSDQAPTVLRYRTELPHTTQCIRIASIAVWSVALAGIAAGHTVDAGGAGELELRCGIVPATETNPDYFTSGVDLEPLNHVVLDQPLRVSSTENIVPQAMALKAFTPVHLTVSPAIATDKRELVAVAAQLVNELVAEFGQLPSDPMLSADGFVIAENCRARALEPFYGWARGAGVLDVQQQS